MSNVALGLIVLMMLSGAPGFAVVSPSPAPQAQTARSLLLERDRRHRPVSEEYLGEVVVVSKGGQERRKTWRSYRSGPIGDSHRLIRFLSPPDVRGVGYLGHFRTGQSPDEWLYTPSTRRERRIGARDREGAFAGTSFSYEDLDLLEFDDAKYVAAFAAATRPVTEPVHVIELRPRGRSAYARKVLALAQKDLRLLGVDYFIGSDPSPAKRLTLTEYTRVEPYLVPKRIEMIDLKKGGRTIINLRELIVDRPQPKDRYTIQNLLRETDIAPAGSDTGRLASARFSRTAAARQLGAFVSSTFSGHAEVRAFAHFGDAAARRATAWATLHLRETIRLGAVRLSGAVRLEASNSPQVGGVGFDPADRAALRSPISIRELSLFAPVGAGLDLQAGRFDLSWAGTDIYSPADAFLPRDLSDPLTEGRLPLWGALLRGERSGVRFEVLVVPVTTPWRLPAVGDAASPFTRIGITLDERPWSVPTRGFQAIRVKGSSRGWDWAGWARSGIRPAAVLDPDIDSSLPLPPPEPVVVALDRRFAREHAAGGSVTHAAGSWMITAELGILRSDDSALGTAAIWSLGASHVVRNGTFTATVAMNAIEPRTNPLLLFDRALLPLVVLAMREHRSWGSWNAGWLSTFRTVGGVFSAEIARDLSDVVKLTMGTELPHGATFSPAMAFTGGQRLRVALRWSW